MNDQVILELNNITKDFPGVRALDDVTINVYRGEILALVGENGAGKSTLIKILSGAYPHGTYKGTIVVKGEEKIIESTRDAFESGIATIYQELMLCNELNVGENIFLGSKPRTKIGNINWNEIYRETSRFLKMFDLNIDPKVPLSKLSVVQKQIVEILKALNMKSEILVLDEPTATMAEHEVDILFKILKNLREQGISAIFVSHKIDEIAKIADRVAVLRDGKLIDIKRVKETNSTDVIELMIGRELSTMYPKEEAGVGEVVLEVKDFSIKDPLDSSKYIVNNVSFLARKDEILGIAGLIGSGQLELLAGIFGVYDPKLISGEVIIGDKKIKENDPAESIKLGMGFISENRKEMGLVLTMNVGHNISMCSLENYTRVNIINLNEERKLVENYINKLDIRTPSIEQLVNFLSGGNQQKVVISKWLAINPKIILLNEPTRGIDVGTKVEIYKILNQLSKEGVSVVMSSSEMPELIGMTDRLLIFYKGRVVKEMVRDEFNEKEIMKYVTGVSSA